MEVWTMCLSAAETNPLCDECFAKEQAGRIKSDADLCPQCQAMLQRYCYGCMTLYATPEDADLDHAAMCRLCRQGQARLSHEREGRPPVSQESPAKDGGR